jgi:hypothetical protein
MGAWHQRCYDADCSGFRSCALPLPPSTWQSAFDALQPLKAGLAASRQKQPSCHQQEPSFPTSHSLQPHGSHEEISMSDAEYDEACVRALDLLDEEASLRTWQLYNLTQRLPVSLQKKIRPPNYTNTYPSDTALCKDLVPQIHMHFHTVATTVSTTRPFKKRHGSTPAAASDAYLHNTCNQNGQSIQLTYFAPTACQAPIRRALSM